MSEDLRLESAIRAHVLRVYELSGRNKTEAARLLGIDRTTLYRYLYAYGLHNGGAL
jgi:transcriptional regulator of acetoin/glycerol metabolism